ncbi:hypothetical protein H2201_000122 [Coniosporium apollinis]|uniref:Uncharacterized protein n=1 Tax=Coniosporium apollinis TaxID=61459 RepID=A0ABQ9P584_9PEZI|nr:hypothetical protein H2201_000122 [Coniosporium apollinis]
MDCVPDVEHNNLRDVRRSQKTRTVDFKAARVVPIGNTKERVAREAPKPAKSVRSGWVLVRDWYYKPRANVFAGDGLRNEKFFESFPDPPPPTNQSTTAQELRTASMALANSTALAPYTSSSSAIKITTCSPGTIRKLVRNHKLLGSLQLVGSHQHTVVFLRNCRRSLQIWSDSLRRLGLVLPGPLHHFLIQERKLCLPDCGRSNSLSMMLFLQGFKLAFLMPSSASG